MLDTGRLKQQLGAELQVDSRNIHAFIIGEHGNSEMAVWSEANVSGLALEDFCRIRGRELRQEDRDRLYQEVRDSAYKIIRRKGVTCYGIAMAVGRIAACIVKEAGGSAGVCGAERTVWPAGPGFEHLVHCRPRGTSGDFGDSPELGRAGRAGTFRGADEEALAALEL